MPVYTTGSTALSFSQQFLRQDPTKYVIGGQLSFFLPGTTTPVSGYKDTSAQMQWPNPYTLEQDGRIPAIYFITSIDAVPVGYTSVRMRLVDRSGVLQFDYDNVPLLGPGGGSGGGGGGGDTTDPNSVFITGDLKARYGVGTLPGFVRANGLTIGPLGSGATEKASAECEALFLYLWNTDPNLIVVGGRGPSAAADWTDGTKLMTLPDYSGRVLGFLDNMSGVPRGVITTSSFGLPGQGPTVLGANGGDELRTIGQSNLPAMTLNVSIPAGQWSHGHDVKYTAGAVQSGSGQFATITITAAGASTGVGAAPAVAMPALVGTAPLGGGGAAFPIVQPTKLATLYIRL